MESSAGIALEPLLRQNDAWQGLRKKCPRSARCAGRTSATRAPMKTVRTRNGSPEDTDLERISLVGPRINQLRDLFVIESGAQTPLRTLCVLTACEYRSCLTQQRVCLGVDGVLAGTRCYSSWYCDVLLAQRSRTPKTLGVAESSQANSSTTRR